MKTPYKLSPVHRVLESLGAKFVDLDGWRVAASIGGGKAPETAGLCDRSHQAKTEYRGADLGRHFPNLPPAGRIAGSFYRTAQDRLLQCGGEAAKSLDGCAHAVDRTSGLAQFLLAGPKSRDILNRLTSLDLRDGSFADLTCKYAPVARVNALVARRDLRTANVYEIFAARESAEYLWGAIWAAGEPFGLCAFGTDTLRSLE